MSNWGLRPSHVGYYAAVSRKVVQQKTIATMPKIACVASVPVRSKRNFTFGPHEKWGESKEVEGRGWGRGKKGTLARKPLDFEKRPLVFTVCVHLLIDNFVIELKSQ